MVETRWPLLSMTRTDPAEALPHDPSGEGKLPTKTKPFCRMLRAVVRPSGAFPWKKSANGAFAGTSTMVVPLPCRFELALKLDTSTSPGLIVPPLGKLAGTKATPYGLRSPLDGTVDTTRTGPGRKGRSSSCAFSRSGVSAQNRSAPTNGIHRFNLDFLEQNREPVSGFLQR